jgi:hypothetical protein
MKELNGADAANVLMLYQDLNNRYLELNHQHHEWTKKVNQALEYLKPSEILPCDCINVEDLTASCECQNYDDYANVHQHINDMIIYKHVHDIFYPKPKEVE